MKPLLISLLFASSLFAATDDQIARAIHITEGGPLASVPYGIKSVRVRNAAHAKQVCLATIRNNRARWLSAGKPGNFLDFLADRYCPLSVDPVGNRNWKKNIHKLIKP